SSFRWITRVGTRTEGRMSLTSTCAFIRGERVDRGRTRSHPDDPGPVPASPGIVGHARGPDEQRWREVVPELLQRLEKLLERIPAPPPRISVGGEERGVRAVHDHRLGSLRICRREPTTHMPA